MTGRKPIPAELIDALNHKKSKDDIEVRQEVERALKTNSELKCPRHLSQEAKKEWRRLLKLYKSMKVDLFCDLDIQAITMYCEASAIYKKAQETWVKYTTVVSTNSEAQRVLDKCLSTMDKQAKLISRLAEQLCITPVGRARIGMIARKEEQPSELEGFFEEED